MKSKINFAAFILILIFSGCLVADKQPEKEDLTLPKYFYKKLYGKIGDNLMIQANLIREDTALSGNYFYEKYGMPITFTYNSRIDSSGNIFIAESEKYDSVYNPVYEGIFKGKFTSENKIEGTWQKTESDKKLNFVLEEKYPDGVAQFDYQHYSKSYQDSLASIKIFFPVMHSFSDSSVQDSINNKFEENLQFFSMFEQHDKFKSYPALMDFYIQRYINEVVNDSTLYTDYTPRYTYINTSSVIFNSDYITSFERVIYIYEGGAHGMTDIEAFSFDLKTGKQIVLDDILTGDYKPALDKLAEKGIRKYLNVGPDVPLDEAGLFLENGKLEISTNFLLLREGIKFQYNQYEIGPYALGAPDVFVKYSDIKDYIKKGSVIDRLIQ